MHEHFPGVWKGTCGKALSEDGAMRIYAFETAHEGGEYRHGRSILRACLCKVDPPIIELKLDLNRMEHVNVA